MILFLVNHLCVAKKYNWKYVAKIEVEEKSTFRAAHPHTTTHFHF